MKLAKGRAAPSEHVSLSVAAVVGGERVVVRTDAPTLLLTMEASTVDASIAGSKVTIDRTGCLIVPRKASISLETTAAAARVAVLGFREPGLTRVARAYRKLGLDGPRLEGWLKRVELLPRTVWVHEIVHRYVFERYALGEHQNAATNFLETEILKEIYFLFRDRVDGSDRAAASYKYSACVERAVAYVEAHLFEPCEMDELAAHAGASESTLLRSFRRELGSTPSAYWRVRRLDEALVLLRSGRQSVAEVAGRVGYDNPTAFAHAFRLRFGSPPSAFQPRRPVRPAP